MTIPSTYYGLPTDNALDADNAISPDYTANAMMLRTLVRNANYLLGTSAKRTMNLCWPDPSNTYYELPDQSQALVLSGMKQAGYSALSATAQPAIRIPFPTSAHAGHVEVRIYGKILDSTGSRQADIYFGSKRKRFTTAAECDFSTAITSTAMGWTTTVEVEVEPNDPSEFIDIYVDAMGITSGAGVPVGGDQIDLSDQQDTDYIEIALGGSVYNGQTLLHLYDSSTSITKDAVDGMVLMFRDSSANVLAIAGVVQAARTTATGAHIYPLYFGETAEAQSFINNLPVDQPDGIWDWICYPNNTLTIQSIHLREKGGEIA